MNERITELMIEAGKTISGDKHIDADFCEKFAKLIVKECANIATINAHQWSSPGTYVLKHFGVEE
jgi:hypothetical protein